MRRAAVLGAFLLACGSDGGSTFDGGDGGGDGTNPNTDAAGPSCKPCMDFPSAPILEMGVPPDAPKWFKDPGSATGGPCLVEPHVGNPGALFPNNWLRPRFRFIPAGGQTLFELRLHASTQVNDLVVYTLQTPWKMPKGMWTALAANSFDDPITVTIRGAPFDGTKLTAPPSTGTTGPFAIAPVGADGSIVYWTTSNGSALKGFHVGEESVVPVYTPQTSGSQTTQCIGCHTSTPDGAFVAMSASTQAGNGDPATPLLRSSDGKGTAPPFLSMSAETLLARTNQELPALSKSHWTQGDRVMLTMLPVNNAREIIWTDLEATSTAQGTGWGVIARNGDGKGAGNPSFSHDGKTVVYHRADNVAVAGISSGADVWIVPYGNRMGGTASALPGASDPSKNEFYPSFSADDSYVAYSRADSGLSYNNANAEVFVVSSGGGTPTRLAANDPAMCTGASSPGVTNSWPKWSPAVGSYNGRTFYWLVFSSTRAGMNRPQLFAAGVEMTGNTIVKQGAAIYLWNQPEMEANHTPAWDVFDIPPAPPN